MTPAQRRYWREAALTVALALVAAAWSFRFQIANGWRVTFGDRYDGLIEIALLQHWANVVAGVEGWQTTAYFAPVANTLGYNDGYLLSGLLYAAVRAGGVDPVLSTDIVHLFWQAIGFVGMVVLCRGALGVRFGWALVAAGLVTTSDMIVQHATHGQLFTLALAPWAGWLLWRCGGAVVAGSGTQVRRWGSAFALLFAGWISTGFYLAWFFTFFVLLATIGALLTGPAAMRQHWGRALGARWRDLAIVAVVAIAALIPFGVVYLPVAHAGGAHLYDAAAEHLFRPDRYISIRPGNLLFGWLHDTSADDPTDDYRFGFTPLLFVTTLAATVALWRQSAVARALGVGIGAAWLLMLEVHGVSLWRLVYLVVPGATGLRAIGRFNLIVLVAAVVPVALWLQRWRRPVLAGAVAALLLVEQIGTVAPVALDRAETLRMVAAIPPPPRGCATIAVAQTRPANAVPDDAIYANNVDAMLLASLWRVRAVNGFSTFVPPGWDFLRTSRSDFRERVRRYVVANRMPGVCVLDMRTPARWSWLGATH